jgi:predicted permease
MSPKHWFYTVPLRLRSIFHRPQVECELDEELNYHLDMKIEENVAKGMSREEARRSALIALGGLDQKKEECRDARGLRLLDSLLRDMRYALRGIRNSLGFSLTVICTLALGLGSVAASFSVFNTLVLKPFAVRDPYSLYTFKGWKSSNDASCSPKGTFTRHEFLDFRRDNPAFSEVAGYQSGVTPIEGRWAGIQAVTGNYFSMLGGRACMGRALLDRDDDSTDGVAVASNDAWKSRFGADPGIVGKSIRIGRKSMEIIGVACPEFTGPQQERVDFWVSLALSEELVGNMGIRGPDFYPQPNGFPQLDIIGRLKPGLTRESAEAALFAYGCKSYLTWHDWPRPERAIIEQRATTVSLKSDSMGGCVILFLLCGLVLLVACANVANMMLARGLARRREIGIRISLGAGRTRVVRQLLTESLLLAIPAALAAFGVAYGILLIGYWLLTNILIVTGGLEFFIMTFNPHNFLPDFQVMAFLFTTAFFTTLIFGLMPAIQTTHSRLVAVNRGEFETGFRPARLRSILVIVQAALCTLLLIISATAMRSEIRVASLNLGLDTDGVFLIQTSEKINHQSVVDHVSSLSSMESIGACILPPMQWGLANLHSTFVGENGEHAIKCMAVPVSPEYFDVYKIAVRGRKSPTKILDFMKSGPADGMEVVISETAAHRLWPSSDALGRTIETKGPDPAGKFITSHFPVIGIAADSVFEFSTNSSKPDQTLVYFLAPPMEKQLSLPTIAVRMKGNPDNANLLLQKELNDIASGDKQFKILPARQELDIYLTRYLLLAEIGGLLGAMALLMTVSGIFSMLSYVVTQRRKEFGIRMALGAGKTHVTGMVLRQSLQLAAVGSVLGVLIALAVGRVLAHSMIQLDLFDASGYTAGVLIVIFAALAASWIPVRRAVNVDPARTLHCE